MIIRLDGRDHIKWQSGRVAQYRCQIRSHYTSSTFAPFLIQNAHYSINQNILSCKICSENNTLSSFVNKPNNILNRLLFEKL